MNTSIEYVRNAQGHLELRQSVTSAPAAAPVKRRVPKLKPTHLAISLVKEPPAPEPQPNQYAFLLTVHKGKRFVVVFGAAYNGKNLHLDYVSDEFVRRYFPVKTYIHLGDEVGRGVIGKRKLRNAMNSRQGFSR